MGGARAPEPRCSLVLDDVGWSVALAGRFAQLDVPLAFAVLPHAPFAGRCARIAHRHGREVLLHLPMAPARGPDALRPGMDDQAVRRAVARCLARVPYARGVNNHMGSVATRNRALMRRLMGVLAERGLFFLDSLTTPHSVAVQEARRRGVPALANWCFLDHGRPSRRVLRHRVWRLICRAHRRGHAVAILHARRRSLRVLRTVVPQVEANGVRWARCSELAR